MVAMGRLVILGLLALATGAFSVTHEKVWPHKVADNAFLQKQLDVFHLFYHVHEPNLHQDQMTVGKSWDLEKNLDKYTNVSAVKLFVDIYEYGVLPRGHPFSVINPYHRFEAETLFHVFFSAKDYETFYNTACWARDHVNEGIFVYSFSVAILHRHDTYGIIIPPIYETFPNFFFDTEILTTAQKLNVYGDRLIHHMPYVHKWNNDIVIDANYTGWNRWMNQEHAMTYFTHDIGLNSMYYYMHLDYPFWLGADVCPLIKDRRGELFLHLHQQLIARYYLERLSNGLGEIPNLSWMMPIHEGYHSGLQYEMGVEMPHRPNNFDFKHHEYLDHLIDVEEYERRIRNAIDLGFIVTETGEHISLRTPESMDVLGRLIESNVDSPNTRFYKDVLSPAKFLLGNGIRPLDDHHVVPSVMEHYQTAMRDPVYYQFWKRILNMVVDFQNMLPMYKREELAMPGVTIKSVDVDKLMTYFEYFHVNLTNYLWMNREEATKVEDHVSVLVRQARLNHKVFNVRVNVNSEVAKTVVVKFFLGPKYDSTGKIIPLHENRMNFIKMNQFTYNLKQGENVIDCSSNEFFHTINDWTSAHVLYEKVWEALHGNGEFHLDMSEAHNKWPQRLLLPKGTKSGMPFTFIVYMHEYKAPKIPMGTGFDPTISTGLSTGARWMTDDPLGYPLDRPIYDWTVEHMHNWFEKEVTIFHKHTPELYMGAHHHD